MLRAVALATRLDFTVDPPLAEAIRKHRGEIARSSPPRLIEEYYKILRAGSSEKAFRGLAEVGLLEPISRELHTGANEALWRSLRAVDAYRRRFESTPDTLTNAILMGSLLVPLGISLHPQRQAPDISEISRSSSSSNISEISRSNGVDEAVSSPAKPRRAPIPRLGALPLARRDVERLRLITSMQRRLKDLGASPKAQRALAHRHIFREALTWLEIHGGAPESIGHWKSLLAENPALAEPAPDTDGNVDPAHVPSARRRRRRRGRRGRRSPQT